MTKPSQMTLPCHFIRGEKKLETSNETDFVINLIVTRILEEEQHIISFPQGHGKSVSA